MRGAALSRSRRRLWQACSRWSPQPCKKEHPCMLSGCGRLSLTDTLQLMHGLWQPGTQGTFEIPRLNWAMRASALSLSAQAIAAAEEEATKKKVGSAAALKQLDKLRKEAVKATSEADKISEELAAKKEEHKVCKA